jgi:hypothetical protein
VNREELIHSLRSSRDELIQMVEGLSEDDLQKPGTAGEWSVKDTLFHLTMWEAELVKLLWQISQVETPTSVHFSNKSVDEINAEWMINARTRTLKQVWVDFHSVRKQTLRRLNDLQNDVFEDPARFDWLDGQPLWVWIAEDTFRHDQEHTKQIKAWRSSLIY